MFGLPVPDTSKLPRQRLDNLDHDNALRELKLFPQVWPNSIFKSLLLFNNKILLIKLVQSAVQYL